MYPKTMTRTFLINRKELSLGGIGGFRCINCGEEYFDANEVSKIDDFLHTVAGTKIENSSQYWRGFYG